MDVILHIGAHRTATTTLQSYFRAHGSALSEQNIGVWGPLRTRKGGLFSGLTPEAGVVVDAKKAGQARRRIARRIAALNDRGTRHLIVSDENMLGTIRNNLRSGALYPDAAVRLEPFAAAFGGSISKVVLSVRSLDDYWSSAWAYGVGRGFRLPTEHDLQRIAAGLRGWQAVIEDVAQVFGGAEITVMAHDPFAAVPEDRLRHMLGDAVQPPQRCADIWRNQGPGLAELRVALSEREQDPTRLPEGEGRWLPFSTAQAARLRETYQDDLFWLHAGAGGIATFIEEEQPDQAGVNLPGGLTTRGQQHDRQDGRLARAG